MKAVSTPRLLLMLVASAVTAGCVGDAVGPETPGTAYLALQPAFRSAASPESFNLTVTAVGVTAHRTSSGVLVWADTVEFPADADAVSLSNTVEILGGADTLDIMLTLFSGGADGLVALFEGDTTVVVFRADADSPAPQGFGISLEYVGPGSDVAALLITPSDTSVTFGDPLTLAISAVDAAGDAVSAFYVSWSADDLDVEIASDNSIRPFFERRATVVRATTPTDVTGSMRVAFVPAATRLERAIPDEASVAVGETLELAVRVLAEDGLGVPNVAVRFAAVGESGTIDSPLAVSDETGLASTTATAGAAAGPQQYTAAVEGLSPVTIDIVALAGAATGVSLFGGDGQLGMVGNVLDLPLEVRVTDEFGNAVSGAAVDFSVASGGGSVENPAVVTDDGGIASTRATLGPEAGEQTFEARAAVGSPVVFSAIATFGPAKVMRAVSGDGQSGVVGTELPDPLVVRVSDEFGNPVVGQRVNFVVTSGGGSVWNGSMNTDENGVAADFWTLGTSVTEPQQVEARAVRALDDGTFERIVFHVFTATALAGPVATVFVTPVDITFDAIGATQQLSVAGEDADGNPVSDLDALWSTSDSQIATVDQAGLVTARGNGDAVITVTVGAVTGTVSVTVQQVITDVVVSPSTLSFSAFGEQATLAASAQDANGNPVSGVSFTWDSSNDAVVAVSTDGVVTAVGNGDVTITVSAGDANGTATVRVQQVIVEVSVSPTALAFAAFEQWALLSAEARDANGHAVTAVTFDWTSSNNAVANVNSSGRVTARGNGNAVITASTDGVSGTATIRVQQVVAEVLVAPSLVTLGPGEVALLSAEPRDANGHEVTGVSVSWESSDETVAMVNASGLVVATGIGEATVTATVGEVSGTARIVATAN